MSNRYIFRYATIMVIIVATLLSAVAMLLQPLQQRNIDVEKMQNILSAAQVPNVNSENAQELFAKYCSKMLVIDPSGKVTDDCPGAEARSCPAFNIDLKEELYNKNIGKPFKLPLYIIHYDNVDINVLPLQGAGLWGPIWGYLAIDKSFSSLIGAVFDHKSETPGLGGEITTEAFQKQFNGKSFMKDGKFVSIKVQKGGVMSLPEGERGYAVDAISGGTITSRGVDAMISEILQSYLPYFKNHQANKNIGE
jgi:NADH:ubiquinone oxidoreductase, Na(+)-translocating, C subunit